MESLVTEVLGPRSLQIVLNDLSKDVFSCIPGNVLNGTNFQLFSLVIRYFTVNNVIQNKLVDHR